MCNYYEWGLIEQQVVSLSCALRYALASETLCLFGRS